MRIVAGRYKGHRLSAPRGRSTRPTSDRVREALFNILFDITEQRVLDLFAGTGAVGLEALSRGATHVTFIESDRNALQALERNLETLQIPPELNKVLTEDAAVALDRLQGSFDLVFADPPYKMVERLDPVLRKVVPLLCAEGILVVEHAHKDVLDLDGMEKRETRRYGDTALSFFVR